MSQYIDLVKNIYDNGRVKSDRTGTGTVSIFGAQLRFDLSQGFPVVTEKFTFMRGVIHELLWLIKGDTNIQYLLDNDVHIWDAWCVKEDIVDEITLTLHERAVLRAEMQGITVAESLRRAHDDDLCQELASELTGHRPSSRYGGTPNGGEKVLDDEGIPRTKKIIRAAKGSLGPVYGKQWRAWPNYRTGGTIDQLAEAIELLKNKPNSRRIIVSAWNPADNPDESIPPHVSAANGFAALNSCHSFFQFMAEPLTVSERIAWELSQKQSPFAEAASSLDDRETEVIETDERYKPASFCTEKMDSRNVPRYRLSCQLYQRSADVALGVPFNIASYALLTYMVAQVVNMAPGVFVHTFGDAHLYLNHLSPNGKHPGTAKEGADTIEGLLERETKPFPKLLLNPAIKNIDDFKFEDIKIIGYEHSGKMTFPVAV